MSPTTIRPVRWRDLRAVAEIQRQSFRHNLAYKYWMLVFFHFFPGVKFWVSWDDDVISGCMIADTFRGITRILNIAVGPDHRRRGVGTSLMRTAIDAWPGQSVVLMVEENNVAAQALYHQFGFERTGYRAAYYGAGYPGIEMTLKR